MLVLAGCAAPGQTRELFTQFKRVSFSVVVSAIITAAGQAIAALGGYLISRVPQPTFFAALTFLVAFVPAIGAASMCLFVAAILYLSGHASWALFLALWGSSSSAWSITSSSRSW